MKRLIKPIVPIAAMLMSIAAHADNNVVFPSRTAAWLKEGMSVKVEAVQQVTPGRSREEVYALLSKPHFSRAYCQTPEWDYLLNLPAEKDHHPLSCQYKVRFDGNGKVKDTHWQDPACEALANPQAEVEAPGPVAAEHFTVAQDLLFAFDKSALDDMLPGGRAELDRISEQVKTAYRKLTLITIIGHADRVGSDTYNQELSLARALTVRDYLLSRGQPNNPIVATGVGNAEPVASNCPGGHGSEAIRCLQPDRRVTIDVLGEKRR